MSGGALETMAICPYYKQENRGIIYCEAGTIKPKDNKMRIELCYQRCAGDWESCQFKLALDHFYERISK